MRRLRWLNLAMTLAVVCSMVLAPVGPAARASAAPPAAGDPGQPEIVASRYVVWGGPETTNLTLTNGLPGHRGYFYSASRKLDFYDNAQRQYVERVIQTTDRTGKVVSPDCTSFGGPAGDVAIYFYDMDLGRALPAAVLIRFFYGGPRPEPPPSALPLITQATSDLPFGGQYLRGTYAPNTVRVTVDFKGQQGYVKFSLGSRPPYVTSSGGSGTYTYKFDMGIDLATGPNRLTIVAITKEGLASKPVENGYMAWPPFPG